MSTYSLGHLSNDALTLELAAATTADRRSTAAESRSNRQVARMIAERFGRAFTKRLSGADSRDAAPFTRSDTGSGDVTCGLAGSFGALVTRTATGRSPDAAGGGAFGPESLACGVEGDGLAHARAADGAAGRAPRRAALRPVAPGQYELVAILGQEAYDQLVASVDLLGHAVPSGDLAEVLERAIALQLAHLRKRRCGAADRPRSVAPRVSSNPRHVPNAVVRAVWERDGDQCTFVGSGGHRCEARDRLELDHIVPVARGGKSTLENLRLLCHTHNQHVAELTFGAATMQGRRAARGAAQARARVPGAERAQGESGAPREQRGMTGPVGAARRTPRAATGS